MSDEKTAAATARIEPAISRIDAGDWDACANRPGDPFNPFLSHAFMNALEKSGAVRAKTGWQPQHIVLEGADGQVDAVMPLYLKSHSRGEYIFDQGWAAAFERAGGQYYPKLLSAVPFTPVTGRRFLTRDGVDEERARAMLLSAAIQLAERNDISSFHANFTTEAEWRALGDAGLLQRTDQQFHWRNDGYASFDDFLGALSSRKRKMIRKERQTALETALESGLEIVWLTGPEITEADWDAFHAFYEDTGARKWGSPYLNRKFFSLLSEAMGDRVLLILCRYGGETIAGALNLIGGDTLYGRYWGCSEYHPCLHFEVCYYQAMDYAIAHGLKVVEAGAQGEHKLARGYAPHTTHSLHWIANPGFRRAVADYLDHEREHVERVGEALIAYTPFRKGS